MKAKDIFNLSNEFKELQVICGDDYLENDIENINIVDVPCENAHFKKGDFVITSLDIIIKEKINLVNIINMLSQENIGMLGLVINSKVNDEIMNHFQQIIILANKINFPVIKIPSKAKYRHIASSIGNIKSVNGFLLEQLKKI